MRSKIFDINKEFIKQVKISFLIAVTVIICYIIFAFYYYDFYASSPTIKFIITVGGAFFSMLIFFELYARRGLLYWRNTIKIEFFDDKIILHNYDNKKVLSISKNTMRIYISGNNETKKIIFFADQRKAEIVPELFCSRNEITEFQKLLLN